MATSLSLENDSSLAQGYLKVNGTTAATLTTSGITGNLTGNVTGNATTATALSTASGSAPSYACRAWVNFDGTRDTSGATSTANTNRLIRASGNVTSVLRNGTGDYTITFTTAMSDANYAVSGSASDITNGTINAGPSVLVPDTSAILTSSIRIHTFDNNTDGRIDVRGVNVAIFGN